MSLIDPHSKGKGKAKEPHEDTSKIYANSSLDSDESDSECITQEYLESLLAKAKAGMASVEEKDGDERHVEEEGVILIGEEDPKYVRELDFA